MSEAPGIEVEPSHMRSSDVFPLIHGKAQSSVCYKRILEVAEAIKRVYRMWKLVIRFGHEIIFVVRRAEVAGELLKRRGN